MKLIILFFLSFSLYAESFESFLTQQNKAFTSYKEERDRAFSSYLQQEWQEYRQSVGLTPYKKRKPDKLPRLSDKTILQHVDKKVLIKGVSLEQEKKKIFKKPLLFVKDRRLEHLQIDYFSEKFDFQYDKDMLFSLYGAVDQNKIYECWQELVQSQYDKSVRDIQEFSKHIGINDWGKYLLVKNIASKLYSNENEQRLFSWFVLLKMGYDVRLAYQTDKLLLLIPIKGNLYNTVFYTFSNRKYYAIDYYAKGRIGAIKSYDTVYEGAQKDFDFSINTLPLFSEQIRSKHLEFNHDKKKISIDLAYDKHLFDFFQTYPQVDYEHYFQVTMSAKFDESLIRAFLPLIKGKGQSEALNVLLSFVQHAFLYKTDKQQFEIEKVMFPSETLFYTYSDCEDRAILFSYLVKKLLGLEIVGIKYSNHMATAVRVQETIDGEKIRYKNNYFVIADPTYVNAGLGLSMPAYRNNKDYVIVATGLEK